MLVIENGITSPNTNIPDFFMAYWYTIMKLVIFRRYIKNTRLTLYYLTTLHVRVRSRRGEGAKGSEGMTDGGRAGMVGALRDRQ